MEASYIWTAVHFSTNKPGQLPEVLSHEIESTSLLSHYLKPSQPGHDYSLGDGHGQGDLYRVRFVIEPGAFSAPLVAPDSVTYALSTVLERDL